MKRRISIRTLIGLVVSLLLMCSSALAEPIRVTIAQPMSHTSLDQIRDTIIAALEQSDIDFEITNRSAVLVSYNATKNAVFPTTGEAKSPEDEGSQI